MNTHLRSLLRRQDGRDEQPSAAIIDSQTVKSVEVTICPPHRPDKNGFVERYHRTLEEECLQVHQPADLEAVKAVIEAFQQHYNFERPHQGLACQNQPPRVAYGVLPARPAVPAMVDPDRWIDAWDGLCFVRKVRHDTSVSVDERRYYLSKEVVGQYVSLRIDASSRSFVAEHAGVVSKQIAIRGTGKGLLPFDRFVKQLCHEARLGRAVAHAFEYQLTLPFG
jgi:hypothetical protein